MKKNDSGQPEFTQKKYFHRQGKTVCEFNPSSYQFFAIKFAGIMQ